MKHPDIARLALHAGGDLGLLARLRVAKHLRTCSRCAAEVDAFRAAGSQLRGQAPVLPSGVDWERLAAEMKANIRVGLAAGACVGQAAPADERLSWRAAVVFASLALVVFTGWLLQRPQPSMDAAAMPGSVLLQTTEAGLELKQGASALTLMHPASDAVLLSVSVQGAVRARYVDDETGQITINDVYAQ